MSLFAYAGVFFACAMVAVLLGFYADERLGHVDDFAIFGYTFFVFVVLLICALVALGWGVLQWLGWLP